MKIANDGVLLAGLKPQMRQALLAAARVMKKYKKELVITCGLDGVHSAGSLHYYGYAIDIRCNYLKDEGQKSGAAILIRNMLPDDYDVIYEGSHIHIEYDPKDEGLKHDMGFI